MSRSTLQAARIPPRVNCVRRGSVGSVYILVDRIIQPPCTLVESQHTRRICGSWVYLKGGFCLVPEGCIAGVKAYSPFRKPAYVF